MIIEWKISRQPIPYSQALDFMEERVVNIVRKQSLPLIWLAEHPAVYTAGISAPASDLLNPGLIPVYKTTRGGKYTYHGPGMRLIYVMLDLKSYFAPALPDVRCFVRLLEKWVINVLARVGIKGEIRKDRVGVWVDCSSFEVNGGEKKIAALGIKISKWVSYHGIALNLDPDLTAFNSIIPCGLREFGITSLAVLNKKIETKLIDQIIYEEFYKVFSAFQMAIPSLESLADDSRI